MANFDLFQQAVAVRSPQYLWRVSWEEAGGYIEGSSTFPTESRNNTSGVRSIELSKSLSTKHNLWIMNGILFPSRKRILSIIT
jgi:hypothetical protein